MVNRGRHAAVEHAVVTNRQIHRGEGLRHARQLALALAAIPGQLAHALRGNQVTAACIVERLQGARIEQALVRLVVIVVADCLGGELENLRERIHESLRAGTRVLTRVARHQVHGEERKGATNDTVETAGERIVRYGQQQRETGLEAELNRKNNALINKSGNNHGQEKHHCRLPGTVTEQDQQKVANENAEGHAEGDLKDSAGMLSTAYIAERYEGSDRRENGLLVAQDVLSEKPSAHRRRNNLHRLKEVCSDSVNTLMNELSGVLFSSA